MEINREKVKKFYDEIFTKIIERSDLPVLLSDYNYEKFLSSIENSSENIDKEIENEFIELEITPNFKIKFQKELFEELFTGEKLFEFSHEIGVQEEKQFYCLEFKFVDTIINPPDMKEWDQDKGIYFYINPKGEIERLSKKVIPYFITTMSRRLKQKINIDEGVHNFYHFFSSIEGILWMDRRMLGGNSGELLLQNLKFLIAKNYGLVEKRSSLLIKFQLNEDEIFSENLDIEKMKKRTSNAIEYYLRGLSTPDIFVQFLSFYQVIEYYSVKYTIENLREKINCRNIDPHEIYKELKEKIKQEAYLIGSLFQYTNDKKCIQIKEYLEKNVNVEKFKKFVEVMKRESSDELLKNFEHWNKSNTGYNFGSMIYKIRNEIVHKKKLENPIEKYSEEYYDIISAIVQIMKLLCEEIIKRDVVGE